MPEHADERAHLVALGDEVAAEDAPAAPCQRHQAGAEAQQRGLARAVRSAEPQDLAALHGERGAGQRGKAPEHGDGVDQLDDRRATGAGSGAVHRPATLPAP